MKRNFLLIIAVLFLSSGIFAQISLPRESQAQTISQTVGDTQITISYSRPNVKGRTIWGCTTTDVIPKGGVTYDCLVPNGQVWRTGANEATVFEITNDVMINGQKLPKGKYGLFTIPNNGEWTIVFNKTWNQWGSFSYDEKQDALRVSAKPVASDFQETMGFSLDGITATTANVLIRWEKISVPFTVDTGDLNARLINDFRRRSVSDPVQMANYVVNQKLTANYAEALGWLDNSIAIRPLFGNLAAKARLLATMGRNAEAITTGEKALEVAKTATPAVNPGAITALENDIKTWKSKK